MIVIKDAPLKLVGQVAGARGSAEASHVKSGTAATRHFVWLWGQGITVARYGLEEKRVV